MPKNPVNEPALSEYNKLIHRITDYAKQSGASHLLGEEDQWIISGPALNYDPQKDGQLKALISQTADHLQAETAEGQESLQRISRFLAADRVVLNALGYGYNAIATDAPRKVFANFFEEGLHHSNPQKVEDFVSTLEEASDRMVMRLVQTMHPTNYHTAFGRENEAALTAIFEKIAAGLSSGEKMDSKTIEALEKQAQEAIDGLMQNMAAAPSKKQLDAQEPPASAADYNDKKVTPLAQVTVAEENALDKYDHNKIMPYIKQVMDDYNLELDRAVTALKAGGKTELAERIKNAKLDEEKIVQYCTWGYGADSDGRAKATSIVLYDGIYRKVPDLDDDELNGQQREPYVSRKRDIRANAKEDHIRAMSCVIQRAAFDDKEFAQYLETNWGISAHNGIQTIEQLDIEKQAKFLQELAAHPDILPSGLMEDLTTIKAGTIGFNRMLKKAYTQFLKDNNLPETTEIESLKEMKLPRPGPRNMLYKLCNYIEKQDVFIKGEKEPVKFRLDYDTLTYERVEFGASSRLFEGCQVVGDDGKTLERIDEAKIRKALDVLKRQFVLDHAIDQYGEKVADRYQIANFTCEKDGSGEDFYAAMMLFQLSGLMKVENGKVISSKLAIQPLLETANDQANAPALFEKLLQDPLVKSYYKTMGAADFMVGYSDGSKSAGNFASEWSIRQNTLKLKKVFDEAFKDEGGIEFHVFDGRGRGDSRGGYSYDGQSARAMAPERAILLRDDRTVQGDDHVAKSISPEHGRRSAAGEITGIITAASEAKEELRKREEDPAYARRVDYLEGVVGSIAERSAEVYGDKVGRAPQTLLLIDAIADNKEKSSRAATRKKPATLDDIRAITLEYKTQGIADAPLNYIGLKAGLEKVMTEGIEGENGQRLFGMPALQELYKSHPFMQDMMAKTAQGLRDYDPNVMLEYAEKAGKVPLKVTKEDGSTETVTFDVPAWARSCKQELDGLRKLVQQVREIDPPYEMERVPPEMAISRLAQGVDRQANNWEQRELARARLSEYDPLYREQVELDKKAHALWFAAGGRVDKETENNLTFVNVMMHQQRALHPAAEFIAGAQGHSRVA